MSNGIYTPPVPVSEVSTGILLMFLSVFVSPLIDIFSKLAIATIPAAEITAARFVVQALCMLPIVVWRGSWKSFSWRANIFHAIRGAVITLSMVSFVTTLKYMPVADAIAIFFVEPIILTILSSIFLKETIGWRRYTACGVGFFGAMLIIQPSFQEVGYVALLPVVSAFCIAIFALMTRVLSHREDPWAMQFQMGIWGLLFCTILLLVGNGTGSDVFYSVIPDARGYLYLLGVGLTAATAGIFGVYAYRAAPASTLAPLQYFEIVSATIFAWLVFGDFPDAVKWLGISIIIASGLYIIWRERRFASKPVSDTPQSALAP
ncbi:drug/metabolite transporter (DMT)-like permease [Rhizobium mesoamericanum]|uniref:DMT family transporter n=1 Tax=Rhizobium mesoamericanum TaxID=1079800 RepID=UPI00278379CF|nr:DMT family transporter [Rhizobium mesoamericanum]MDQ0561364.1 drug/metabolite transporter (DMT)-like permease [Rhizobium mesoamericanum]